MKKAAFLDRDGVINRKAAEGHYVTRWEEMEFLPGVGEAIRLLRHAGFLIVVITNQRCVARGLISTRELEAMHVRMSRELAAAGSAIDAIYFCPHENEPPCACRKPRPGMLLQAARDYAFELSASWMIGDSAHDVEAGRRAGCSTALIVDENEGEYDRENENENENDKNHKSSPSGSDLVASSLLDAVHKILQLEAALPGSPRRIASTTVRQPNS